MSILGNLFSKILGHKSSAPPSTPAAMPKASVPGAAATPSKPAAVPAPAKVPAVLRMDAIDLEELLDDLVKKGDQKLDWRHSIVDLMKAVGMESSLAERKELAKELGYSGDTSDSAKMNVWLHAQVFSQIAANGGKVPASLKD